MRKDDQMRLVMLGASGKLGCILRAAWQDSDIALLCQSRGTADLSNWLCFDPLREPLKFARSLARTNAVINLAAPVPRGGPVDLSLHTRLAVATLRAAQQAGVRQVFLASSAAIYGRASGPIDEAAPLVPISPYGQAKLQMEQAIAAYIATTPGAPNTTLLRIGNVVGADQLLGTASKSPQPLDRFPDGLSPRRSYIGPATLARVLATLVKVSGAKPLPRVLNIAAPGTVAMADLLRANGSEWVDRCAPGGAIPEVQLDTRLLQRFVDFTPASQTAAGMVKEWHALRPDAVARAC